MTYKFEDEVRFNESRDVVWSWLLDDSEEPVLQVEMSRAFLKDRHGTDWGNRREVTVTFARERTIYLGRAEAAAKIGERVVQIFNRSGTSCV